MNRVWRRIAFPLAAIAALSACGTQPTYATVEDAVYAGALCTDRSGIRVPDDYCPIGDGDVDGYPYQWRYQSYRSTDHDLDIVYVGYPVTNTWSTQRPTNVSTLRIDRGSFPADPPKGSRATFARVETAPARTKQQTTTTSSDRGGLGSTTGRNAATAAGATPGPAPKGAIARKSLAPPPKAARPMGSTSPKKAGK
jgi:hypothetical protein